MRKRRAETAFRVVGGSALVLGVLLLFPSLVSSGADYPEPGSDTLRLLSLQHPVHIFALALAALGVTALVAAWILDHRE
jgi:hypothetical protein